MHRLSESRRKHCFQYAERLEQRVPSSWLVWSSRDKRRQSQREVFRPTGQRLKVKEITVKTRF